MGKKTKLHFFWYQTYTFIHVSVRNVLSFYQLERQNQAKFYTVDLKWGNIYLAETQEGEHGEDGRRQRKDQQVFADAVPLQAGVHQEGNQAERCRRLKS